MAKKLIIVESPAKVKTIKKFLGAGYDVAASGGHVRDLPKSTMGIDTEHDFEPRYITIRGKGDVLADLRRRAKNADKVYLATDPDREGEAIAWHLTFALGIDPAKTYRISFNEITKKAVKEALKEPREIDIDLVNAQQGRRVLDRLVGYSISPILWKKVKKGLSAGRVQSATLRMICDREEAIAAFVPEEYWTIDAELKNDDMRSPLVFHYYGTRGEKTDIPDEKTAQAIAERAEKNDFTIAEIRKGERVKKAPAAFTTSTLQQEASKRLNFSTGKTMRIAQQLYEGVELGKEGVVGIITYLRTDSTRIAAEAQEAAKEYIGEEFGEAYLNSQVQNAAEGRIQDAHEAIRPTDIRRTPSAVKEYLNRDQLRLYQLIWKRFTASLMSDAVYETIQVRAMAGEDEFRLSDRILKFDGFESVYDDDDSRAKRSPLTKLREETSMQLCGIVPEQHFTQPEPHYTEASLVRAMEEKGIGRPSTYAPTIMTLTGRYYIAKESKNLYVTELGDVVNTIMKGSFPEIVDTGFTAEMEKELDDIAQGDREWKDIIREFYRGFEPQVEEAEKSLEKIEIGDEETDQVCELCGRKMVIKIGRNGKFLACSGFPECRNTKPFYEKTDHVCPKCGGAVLVKRSRKGRRYFGCENNPTCDYMVWRL